jgi:hypothetical protein
MKETNIWKSQDAKDFAGTSIAVYDPWTGETHRVELA